MSRIRFHKIGNRPPTTEEQIKEYNKNNPTAPMGPDQDHIWLSSSNGIFVADRLGFPRQIGMGFISGDGPPNISKGPGTIYYDPKTNVNYISNKDGWKEIGGMAPPGTAGANPNGAGNIFVNDSGNWFQSNNLEFVLQEIGSTFPWYFGKKHLLNYDNSVKMLEADLSMQGSAEKLLTGRHSSHPVKEGWITQRLTENRDIYGFVVGKEGNFFTRYNNKFTELAQKKDVDNLINNMGLSVGSGLISSGDIQNGMTINLNPGLEKQIKDSTTFLNGFAGQQAVDLFLRKDQDDQSLGNITLLKKDTTTSTRLRLRDAADPNNRVTTFFYFNPETKNAGLYRISDEVQNYKDDAYVRHNVATGGTQVQSFKGGTLFLNAMQSGYKDKTGLSGVADKDNWQPGNIQLNSRNPVDIRTDTNAVINFSSYGWRDWDDFKKDEKRGPKIGNLKIGNSENNTYLESHINSRNGGYFTFRGKDSNTSAKEFYIKSIKTYIEGNLTTGDGITIGRNKDSNSGTGKDYAKLYIYPYGTPTGVSVTNGLKRYVAMGYDIKSNKNRLYIANSTREGVKDTDSPVPTSNFTIQGISATFLGKEFKQSSTEEIKENIVPLKEGQLKQVLEAPVYSYNFKGDSKEDKRVGFIIERNAPREAVDLEEKTIDTYAMVGILWKGFQEYVELNDKRISQLESRLEKLEQKQ